MSTQHEEIKYSYKGVPTLKAFARDNSPIRSVIGPFGSGKSTAVGPVEIVRRAMQQQPHPDGIRRTRWMVVRNCYDDETEILTHDRGWKLFKDLAEDDEVAMLKDGKTVFVKPSYHYSKHYVGEMIGFESEGVNFCVTPDHKLSVSLRNCRKKEWSEYRLRKAHECYGKTNMRVRRSADWDGEDCGLTKEMFEWLGYWFAEGSTTVKVYSGSKRHNCVITCKNDVDYASDLFVNACLPMSRTYDVAAEVYRLRLSVNNETRPLINLLSSCGKAINKAVPSEWKNAPKEHLKRFIKGYLAGDGQHCVSGTERATTASKQLADDVQEMALRCGYVVNQSIYKQVEGKFVINGRVTQQNAPTHCLSFISDKRHEPLLVAKDKYKGWHKKQYAGKVYCVEVPTHIVYVRRRGLAFWCSQTYKQLEDTTIKTFHEWLPPNFFGEYQKSDHNYTINAFPNCEIEVNFRALDRPEHVRNVLSYELTGAFVNEAREIPWALIGPLFGRTGRYPSKRTKVPCTWRGVFMDSNAPPMNHWMYRIHEKKKLTEHEQKMLKYWTTYNQPSGLSPQAENRDNLPDDYYEMMASMMTEDQIKVYIENQYGYLKHGKPVYDTWRDRVHGRKDLFPQDAAFTILRGWDFGLTPACVLAYVAPSGQLRIFKEFTTERAGIGDFAKHVISWCTQHLGDFKFDDWGDPSGDAGRGTSDKSGFEVLEGLGVMIQGASNDPMIRLESTRYGLNTLIDGEAALVVDMQECTVVTEGFQGGYEYRRIITSASERYSEAEPNKNNYSHPHDAVQYITQRVFGDMVLYNQGGVDDMKSIPQRQMIDDEPDFDLYGALNPDYEMPTEQVID